MAYSIESLSLSRQIEGEGDPPRHWHRRHSVYS